MLRVYVKIEESLLMAEEQQLSFDAPIAGMSMTSELGSTPWQQPPQHVTVEQAIDYYLPKLGDENFRDQLLDVMELGIPLTTIANGIQLGGVMSGVALKKVKMAAGVEPEVMEQEELPMEMEEPLPSGLMARRM